MGIILNFGKELGTLELPDDVSREQAIELVRTQGKELKKQRIAELMAQQSLETSVEQELKDAEEGIGPVERAADFAMSIGRSAVEGTGKAMRAAGRMLSQSPVTFGGGPGTYVPPEVQSLEITENLRRLARTPPEREAEFFAEPVTQAGTRVEEFAAEEMPVIPGRESTLPVQVGGGVGSVVGLAPALVTGPAAPVAGALLYGGTAAEAAAQDAGRTIRNQIAAALAVGDTEKAAALERERFSTENLAAAVTAPIGAVTEAGLGVGPKALGRIVGNKAAAGLSVRLAEKLATKMPARVASRVAGAGEGFVQEASQEGLEQILSNTAARMVYDPDREITEGLAESMVVGGLTGKLVGGVMGVDMEAAQDRAMNGDITGVPLPNATKEVLQTKPAPAPEPEEEADLAASETEAERKAAIDEAMKLAEESRIAATGEQPGELAIDEQGKVTKAPTETAATTTTTTPDAVQKQGADEGVLRTEAAKPPEQLGLPEVDKGGRAAEGAGTEAEAEAVTPPAGGEAATAGEALSVPESVELNELQIAKSQRGKLGRLNEERLQELLKKTQAAQAPAAPAITEAEQAEMDRLQTVAEMGSATPKQEARLAELKAKAAPAAVAPAPAPAPAAAPQENPKVTSKTMMMEGITDAEGYRVMDTAGIIAFAESLVGSPKERAGFPKFSVTVDGESREVRDAKSLDKLLQVITAGPVRVFRNAGKGVTLDFDNPGKVEAEAAPATTPAPAQDSEREDFAETVDDAATNLAEVPRLRALVNQAVKKGYITEADGTEIMRIQRDVGSRDDTSDAFDEFRSLLSSRKPKPTPAPTPATPASKQRPVREVAAEFDKVLEDAAIELGWVEDIDALATPKMPKGAKQDAISISAKIARSKETAKMRNYALDLMGESKTKAMTPSRKAELLPKLKALVERERTSGSMLTITEPNERRPLGVPANELAVGDELGMPDGKAATVTDIDPDTGDVGITSASGIVVNVPEGSTVYVTSRKAAEQSTEFAPEEGPKLAAGVKQGDLIASTQREDFALVGEKGTDAAKAKAEKEAAAKAKEEARALQEKQQLGLFSPQEQDAQAKADASTKRQADALKAEQQSNLQQKGQAALNFLDKLEKDIKGAMFSDPLFLSPLAQLAITFAKALVRGGMALEQAIRQAIQQAREVHPNDPVNDEELAKAMTGTISWMEQVKPSPAMQEDRKFSDGMLTGTYVAESDKGWHERAVEWVDQFGGNLMLALQKTSRPDPMSGMTDALKEYALQEIMSRANDVLKAKQSAEAMRVAGEVMDQAAEDLKAIGAEAGQALRARRLSQQRYSFLYPVLSLRGLIKRMHKRIPFPEVGDDAIRKWVMAARQRAVQELLKDTSKADAIVAREFKREARDLGVVWSDVMRSALVNQSQVKRSIMQAIVRHPQLKGLSADAITELANMLGKQWQQKRNEAMHAELAKFIDMPRVKPKVRKLLMNEVPRIIQWANLGVLTNAAFRDAIAPLFGMEQLNGDLMQRVVDMSQEAQRVGGSNRDRMIEQIYHFIQRSGKIRWQDIARDYWYASVLSGVMTQVDNAMGIINGGLNIAMMAGLSGRGAAGVIRAGARGAKQAVVDDFFKILWRGDLWRAASFNRERPENALEGLAESRNLFLRVLSAGKFVRRLQNALDHVTGLATEQAALAYVLYREGREADLQRMLEPTANDISQARAIAEAEGTPADSMQRRIREILQQAIPDELVLESKDIRRLVTFQNSPHGVLGSVYHGLNAAEKHFPLIKFLSGTNFARFASNYGNELLNYNPAVAVARWVLSDPKRFGAYRGGKPMWGVFRIPEISQTERSLIAVKGMVGAAVAAAAAALFLGDDDKGEQDIDITGSFKSLTPQQKNQLLAQGKKPYSIKIGDTYVSYRQLGFGGVMTVIGEIRDRQLYDPKFSKESAVSKWTDAGLSGLLVVRDSSAIAALMETVGFLNAYKYDTSQLKEKAGPKYLSRLMGSAIPTILKDVDAWADPQMFKANSGWDYFLQTVPYLRREVNGGLPMVNILGEPISVERYPWSRWVKQRTDDPEFKTLASLAERGVFMPTPAATAVTMPNGKRRELTAKERYEYAVETGKLYRQFIRRDGRKLLAMDPDKAADAISEAAAKARRNALGKVTKTGTRTQREAE